MLNLTIFKHAPILINGKHVLQLKQKYDNGDICLQYRGTKHYFKRSTAIEIESDFIVIYQAPYKIGANLEFKTPRNATLQRATGTNPAGGHTWYPIPLPRKGKRQTS